MPRLQAAGLVLLLAAGGFLLAANKRIRWPQRLSPLWVSTVHDIQYGRWPENRLDILRRRWSARAAGSPAVIVFHGGGWAGGNREDMLVRVCHRYLERGFVVANVEYRKGAIGAAVEDAALALQWFTSHAAEYGGNPARIVVTGESAGAHLALMAAFRSPARMAAVVNIYGVSDLTLLLNLPAIRQVLPPGDPESAGRALSPVTYVRRGLPPVLSIHGTADELVPAAQTVILTRIIRDAGSEASAFYVDGGKHGFSQDQQERAYREVFRFLERWGVLSP
jgi:acetyl esterase/lipase